MRLRRRAATPAVAFEAYGVPVRVQVDDRELLAAINLVLPPVRTPAAPDAGATTFSVTTGEGGTLSVLADSTPLITGAAQPVAIGLLDAQLRLHIAATTTERVFVHAGAVAVGDRALLLPGDSFAGKSTLVATLIGLGATYFSDEYAVLDDDGRVHPYPKPLSIRGDGRIDDVPAETMGAAVADRAATVSGIVVAQYRPGATWEPQALGSGETVLALLAHTVPAQERPADSLRAVSRAAAGAWCWRSDRGEATELAPTLMSALTSDEPPPTPATT